MSEQPEPGAPLILTVDEAADYLRLSPQSIYKLLRAGRMPGRRIGALWRIPRDELDAYLRGEWRPPVGDHAEE